MTKEKNAPGQSRLPLDCMPADSPTSGSSTSWLAFVLILAAVVRGIYLIQLMLSPLWELHRADHEFYREWGRRIAEGEFSPGHVFEQGPLYAYILGAFYACLGTHDLALDVFQSASGLLLVWLTYRIGQIAFCERTARLASILVALYGPLIFFECLTMKSFLTAIGSTSIIYFLLTPLEAGKAVSSRRWWSSLLLSSSVTAALCLIRENYILFLPAVMASGFCPPAVLVPSLKMRLTGVFLPVCVVAILTAPSFLHNLRVSSEPVWITSGGGEVLYMAWAPDASGYYQPPPFIRADPDFEHEDFRLEASRRLHHPVTYRESSRFWSREAVSAALQSPLRSIQLTFKKLLIALNDFEVPDSEFFDVWRERISLLKFLPTFGWLTGLGLVGIFLTGFRDRRRLIVLSAIAVHLGSIILIYNFSRFRIGMIPAWILFSSFAGVTLWQRFFHPVHRRQRMQAILLTTTAIAASMTAFLPPPGVEERRYVEMEQSFQKFLDQRTQSLQELRELEAVPQPNSVDALLKQAELAYVAKLPERADRALTALLKTSPQHHQGQLLLAVLAGERGDYIQAEELLQQALRQTPEDPALWANLGNARFHQALKGTLSSQARNRTLILAKEAYQKGLSIDPNDPTCQAGVEGVEQSMRMSEQQ